MGSLAVFLQDLNKALILLSFWTTFSTSLEFTWLLFLSGPLFFLGKHWELGGAQH